MLFNVNDSTGLLIDKLKRRRQAIKNHKQKQNLENTDQTNQSGYTDFDAKNDFEFLKTTALNDNNLALFKEKMCKTTEYRTNILYDKMTDLLEVFSFLFICPELVNNFIQYLYYNVQKNHFYPINRFYSILSKDILKLIRMH